MGRQKNKRKRKQKAKDRSSARGTSDLAAHKQAGKTLVPPILDLPNLQPSSWRDERLPEMLWAVLLVGKLDRAVALDVLRGVGLLGMEYREESPHRGVTLSDIADREDAGKAIVAKICETDAARDALAPLLLFDELPGYAYWRSALEGIASPSDSEDLAIAVLKCLHHQSQESTDCRWVRMLFELASDRFRSHDENMIQQILQYPHLGDMRSVRPMIRATEIQADVTKIKRSLWCQQFWHRCLAATDCVPGASFVLEKASPLEAATSRSQVESVRAALLSHFAETLRTSSVDAKHDAVFGIALYGMTVLDDLLGLGISQSTLGRFALRTLLELRITLAYLVDSDSSEHWARYRNYGSGQAKLSLLKVDEEARKPQFLNEEVLELMANEDVWEEFVKIDLGNWDKTTIRKMSERTSLKPLYDRYYPWTSGHVDGHWGAVREVVFETCLNPLHRGHRVPVSVAPSLPDVLSDACLLIDGMLALVDEQFPGLPQRVSESPPDGNV